MKAGVAGLDGDLGCETQSSERASSHGSLLMVAVRRGSAAKLGGLRGRVLRPPKRRKTPPSTTLYKEV